MSVRYFLIGLALGGFALVMLGPGPNRLLDITTAFAAGAMLAVYFVGVKDG